MSMRFGASGSGVTRAQTPAFTIPLTTGLLCTVSSYGLLAPVVFAKTSGATSLSINSSTGGISTTTTSTAGAMQTLGGTATGADGVVVPFVATMTGQAAALTITGTPGAATQNTAYTFTPTTSGGTSPYTFALTGTLPAGLAFSTSTGAITGTPTVAATTSGLNITVTDSAGATASLGAFSLVVAASSGTIAIPQAANLLLHYDMNAPANVAANNATVLTMTDSVSGVVATAATGQGGVYKTGVRNGLGALTSTAATAFILPGSTTQPQITSMFGCTTTYAGTLGYSVGWVVDSVAGAAAAFHFLWAANSNIGISGAMLANASYLGLHTGPAAPNTDTAGLHTILLTYYKGAHGGSASQGLYRIYVDGICMGSLLDASGTTNAINQAVAILNKQSASGYGFQGNFYDALFWQVCLLPGDAITFHRWACQRTAVTDPFAGVAYQLWDGNSRLAGQGANPEGSNLGWGNEGAVPYIVSKTLQGRSSFGNFAIDGMVTNQFATYINEPTSIFTALAGVATKVIMMSAWDDVNALGGGGGAVRTPAQIIADKSSYNTALRSAAASAGIALTLVDQTALDNHVVDSTPLSAAMRTAGTSGLNVDVLIDAAANTTLGTLNGRTYPAGTYPVAPYWLDGLHFYSSDNVVADGGYYVHAAYISPSIPTS